MTDFVRLLAALAVVAATGAGGRAAGQSRAWSTAPTPPRPQVASAPTWTAADPSRRADAGPAEADDAKASGADESDADDAAAGGAAPEADGPDEPDSGDALDEANERIDALEKRLTDFLDDAKEDEERVDYPTVEIAGRIHFDSVSFLRDTPGIGFFENPTTGDDPEGRILFRRIRLAFSGLVNPTTPYAIQVDFNQPQDPQILDVFVGFTDLPVLQTVLVGNQKRPLNLDQLNSSNRNLFIERPLIGEAFDDDARRPGVCAYGVSEGETFNWQYGAFLLENIRNIGISQGDVQQASLNGRLSASPLYECDGRDYVHLGLSGMVGFPDGDPLAINTAENQARFRARPGVRSERPWLDTGPIDGATRFDILGLELIANRGPLQLCGEYMSNRVERDPAIAGSGPDAHFHGGYLYAAYMLTGEHVGYDRESGQIGAVKPFRPLNVGSSSCDGRRGPGAWQVMLRYDTIDLTENDVLGGRESNWTAGLNWYFNERTSLMVNAVYGEIRDREPAGGFTSGEFTGLQTRLRLFF